MAEDHSGEIRSKARVTIYSRPGCCLCHDAEAAIRSSPCRQDIVIDIINIEEDPQLMEAFQHDIPIVFINGTKAFKHRVSSDEFCRKVRRLMKR